MKTILPALLVAFLLFGCASPLPEGVTADGHAYRGAANPKVLMIEYSDFECPFCAQAQPTVEQLLRAYPNEVQLQYRHFPLTEVHPRAFPSAVASVCAEKQGKFWPMHDRLFANQKALADADLRKYAGEIGLDLAAYDSCIASSVAQDAVRAGIAEGQAVGVQSTPTFKVGDTVLRGAQPFAKFKSVIDAEIAKAS